MTGNTTRNQFFPEIISTKDDKYDEHPIMHAAMNGNNIRKVTNMMAVLNVPSMAEFAIELGSFENHERGGSLTYSHSKTSVIGRSYNVLQYLTMSSWSWKKECPMHQKGDDSLNLNTLKKLKKSGFLKEEDVRDHDLLGCLLNERYHNDDYNASFGHYFPRQRFEFLTDLDPTSLSVPTTYPGKKLPIHLVVTKGHAYAFHPVLKAGLASVFFMKDGEDTLMKARVLEYLETQIKKRKAKEEREEEIDDY